MFARLIRLPTRYHHTTSAAVLISKCTYDTGLATRAAATVIGGQPTRCAASLLGALLMLMAPIKRIMQISQQLQRAT